MVPSGWPPGAGSSASTAGCLRAGLGASTRLVEQHASGAGSESELPLQQRYRSGRAARVRRRAHNDRYAGPDEAAPAAATRMI
jgi:hypothetical protein